MVIFQNAPNTPKHPIKRPQHPRNAPKTPETLMSAQYKVVAL